MAGLGRIGKSCLLITPEAGPRVHWATVLTDAPMQVTGLWSVRDVSFCVPAWKEIRNRESSKKKLQLAHLEGAPLIPRVSPRAAPQRKRQ